MLVVNLFHQTNNRLSCCVASRGSHDLHIVLFTLSECATDKHGVVHKSLLERTVLLVKNRLLQPNRWTRICKDLASVSIAFFKHWEQVIQGTKTLFCGGLPQRCFTDRPSASDAKKNRRCSVAPSQKPRGQGQLLLVKRNAPSNGQDRAVFNLGKQGVCIVLGATCW